MVGTRTTSHLILQLSYKYTAFLCTTHSLILQLLHKNVVGPCTTHYLILELFSIPKHKHAFDLDKFWIRAMFDYASKLIIFFIAS